MPRVSSLACLLLACGSAGAHTSGASFLSLREHQDGTLRAQWDFDLRDLHQLHDLDTDGDGAVTWGEILGARAHLEAVVLARTKLSAAGRECAPVARQAPALAEHGEGVYLRLMFVFSCAAGSSIALDHSGWLDSDPGHRALLEYRARGAEPVQAVLSAWQPQWRAAQSSRVRLRQFLLEGVRHLLTGYDHLAFLGVLLLALARHSPRGHAPPLRSMLRRAVVVITAFTAAHSLTLALAATGRVSLPPQPVEVAIAASVLLAALLNLWRGAGRQGWKLALAFGLVHGLGFAGALAELAGGGIDLLALAAFNVGIELGQVAVASVAVPLLWGLFRKARRERIGVPLASALAAGAAAFWISARLIP